MSPDKSLLDRLMVADDAGEVAHTRHLCETVLAEFPEHGPTLIRYARVLTELSHYAEADSILDRAERVVSETRSHLVFAQRGHRFEHMGDLGAAEACHLEAHKLDPDDATYLIYAASVAFRRGDIQRAEELARRSLECSEGCLDEAYFNLGGYLMAQKRFVEARDCYLRAIEIDSDYSLAKKRLADVELVL